MQENIPPNTQDDQDALPAMDYDLLINLVSKYPILYDMSLKDYKNTELKASCWQAIGQVMGQSAADCSARWLRLKDCYRREKTKRAAETKSGSGATKRKGFAFYQSMCFIENCPNKRKSHTNVSSSFTPVCAKKQFHGYHLTPRYSSMSMPSFPSNDANEHLMMSSATSATPISSYGAATHATRPLLPIPNASQIVSSFLQSPSMISASPELCLSSVTDISAASSTSPTVSQDLGTTFPTSSATLISETVSASAQSPISATPMSTSSETVCKTSWNTANPSLTTLAIETRNQDTAPTVTCAIPDVRSELMTSSNTPFSNTLINEAERNSYGQILRPPLPLTPNSLRTSTPTSNYEHFGFQSASVCSTPGSASPMSSSCSSDLNTPKSCFSKDSVKSKKIDPLEASFMSLSAAMQNRLKNPVRVETEKNMTSDNIFGQLVASELTNMTPAEKIEKKRRILEILFPED